jgi:hypothetical protein
MNRLFSAAGLFTVLAATTFSYGQSSTVKADVPFAFQMGETTMPAGTYFIRESGFLLTVQGEAGHPSAMILANPESRRDKASHGSLEFTRYGGDYFLTKVWDGDSEGHGRALPKGKREKELARRATFGQTEQVALQTNRH